MANNASGAREADILAEIESLTEVNDDIKYSLGHLKTHLKHCFTTIGNEKIEFTPAFLPSMSLNFIANPKIRRIYLSATMNTEAEFIRTFGRQPYHINVDTDAGNGERLIIFFFDKLKNPKNAMNYYREQVRERKVLFAVPSIPAVQKWSEFGSPVPTKEFSRALWPHLRARAMVHLY